MTNSIYSPSGINRVSAVNTYNTVRNRANLNLVQQDYAPLKTYSASINATGGNYTAVSAIAGRSIVVDGYVVSATGAATARFVSNTGNYISGTIALSANGSVSVSAGANMATNIGEALIVNTNGVVGGSISYRIV